MEYIGKAVARAKESRATDTQAVPESAVQQPQFRQYADTTSVAQAPNNEVMLNGARLESKRIISHNVADPRSKSFDMLRTQVLQSMDLKSWQILGITSPTAGCGKTVTAINLALSIARLPDRSVLLIDMDLQRPQVANLLGLKCNQGLLGVLGGRINLSSAIIQARIGNEKLLVLPCETATLSSSEWMASRPMSALLQDIKRDFREWIVILDLPPVLTGDDVITILPQIDCVLFVAAAGTTTGREIKECNKHLESAPVVRVVLNKASDAPTTYYSYSGYANNQASPTKRRNAPAPTFMSRLLKRLNKF